VSRCRSCQAEIRWVRTEHDRRMPLDREPYAGDDPRGLFVLRGDTAIAVPPGAFQDEPLYRSHFATCEHAAEHRTGR
jgi:hypothetical protein